MSGCVRFRVRGIVQGVFFRTSTRDQAKRLGLTGWVRNCSNGDVELTACGDEIAVSELEHWLRQGPRLARVKEVLKQPSDELPPAGFVVR